MATEIPNAIADVELQLASAVSVGGTSFTLSSAKDDDGNDLPAGKYCFAVDTGTSNKEYLLGQLNGTDVTSVVSVNRQGTESSGAVRAHRIGAPIILTNFAVLQRVADVLNGDLDLDGSSPLAYDSEPTVTGREEIATVGYVLDAASGDVAFGAQTISSANAGETVAEDDLVYFKTSDQEWYHTDGTTAATVNGVQIGIALGAGTDGAGITGGVQISGPYTTTGLTAGSTYYASDTNGGISTSAGTNKLAIGVALSTTRLFLFSINQQTLTTIEKDALKGTSGTPSSTNKFVTANDTTRLEADVQEFTADGTWNKPSSGSTVLVEAWGGGASGAVEVRDFPDSCGGGGGGAYVWKWFDIGDLGSSESVTVGEGGNGVSATAGPSSMDDSDGNNGEDSTFGSHLTAPGGDRGAATNSPGSGDSDGGNLVGIFGDVYGAAGDSALYSGGGGHGNNNGGNSVYGGGGGGGAGGGTNGGSSVFAGDGSGGVDRNEADATSNNGDSPAGGSGAARVDHNEAGSFTATSGDGGDGMVRVTTF